MYKAEELYEGFKYPDEYLELIDLGIKEFEVWRILSPEESEDTLIGMSSRYSGCGYVPFAKCRSTDDVACYRVGYGSRVLIVHDWASRGWEKREEYEDIWAWIHYVVDELKDEVKGEIAYRAKSE